MDESLRRRIQTIYRRYDERQARFRQLQRAAERAIAEAHEHLARRRAALPHVETDARTGGSHQQERAG